MASEMKFSWPEREKISEKIYGPLPVGRERLSAAFSSGLQWYSRSGAPRVPVRPVRAAATRTSRTSANGARRAYSAVERIAPLRLRRRRDLAGEHLFVLVAYGALSYRGPTNLHLSCAWKRKHTLSQLEHTHTHTVTELADSHIQKLGKKCAARDLACF